MFDPKGSNTQPKRKSIRLPGYDYSLSGAYFVTICALGHVDRFGEIVEGILYPSAEGEIIEACWAGLPHHYSHVELDAFVTMPNHIHGIIILRDSAPVQMVQHKRHALSEIVRALKTFSARRINEHHGTPGEPVWQRNYYEHIIRNDSDLDRIRAYIATNPSAWQFDIENPFHKGESEFYDWLRRNVSK
jgi:putative transposase